MAKRRESKLTQSALAKQLAVPQSLVSKVERGERLLDVIEFARYIAAFGGDPVQAFSELLRDSKVLNGPGTPKAPKRRTRSRR